MYSDKQLAMAEEAIIALAEAMEIGEDTVVALLREGLESLSPIRRQLGNRYAQFIEEMENTFGEC